MISVMKTIVTDVQVIERKNRVYPIVIIYTQAGNFIMHGAEYAPVYIADACKIEAGHEITIELFSPFEWMKGFNKETEKVEFGVYCSSFRISEVLFHG